MGINQNIAVVANNFLQLVILLHLMMSAQLFAGWPGDRVCGIANISGCAINDIDNTYSPPPAHCILPDDQRGSTTVFVLCDKSLDRVTAAGFFWPPLEPYQTVEQRRVVRVYRVVIAAMLCCLGLAWARQLANYVYRLFYSSYSTDTRAMDIPFSVIVESRDDMEVEAYVPNITDETKHLHPLLMCDLALLDENNDLVSFTAHRYEDWCCYSEQFVGGIGGIAQHQSKGTYHPAFSICKYYGAPKTAPEAAV